ncbi:lipoprotein-anchoring transpeptidase ErfK/SrfK [Natranaerovirga pectinivora]|uniref:Lipoprotein-anchoring transpeptidase ErfK/SrfK n=1 Tax=Natranaerovirga pectinivora TaxID=682400 RepID=A0A4V2UZP4_9FIRM|nr:L,D-transpeptidase [Natranaerovirga pectinivora]TCT12162.1 lipoprotein-anchoring transpeptidase ErfK/SrfK [Natranaerovirga pectinivora]
MVILIDKRKAYFYIGIIGIIVIIGIILNIIFFKSRLHPTMSTSVENIQIHIKDIEITNNKGPAELYPLIEIICSDTLKDGKIIIDGIKGRTEIADNKLIYIPGEILQPRTTYKATIEFKGLNDQEYHKELWSFKTKSLDPEEVWVEVSLNERGHKVYVRNKNELIREMTCSGGTADEPTILGTYYLENRGDEFYSERFKEGALYWVRIQDQYLFHSIPRDKDWNIIEEELKKLGGPASHGCIRLEDKDAKWFYENIPDGTMVIIHDF